MNDWQAKLENLDEVMGLAARYGPSPSLERQYAEIRLWMLGHWKPAEKRWHRGDAVEDFLSVPTLEGQLERSGDRLPQRIESMRAVLLGMAGQTPTQVVH
jgi:hypothetical protein